MTRPVRRTLAASAAALSLLAFAGCGGDDSDSGASKATSSETASESPASDATSAAPTEDAEDAEDAGDASAAAGEEISAEQFGEVMDQALEQATTADVTTSSSTTGLSGQGQIDYSSDPPAVKMTASVAQLGDIDMILVDGTMYMKGSVFGDKYVSLALDDPSNPLSSMADQLDPAAAFDKLVSGVTKATYVGEEDVDGEQMDHYATTIDAKALLADVPKEAQGAAALPDTIDYQWWFDGDGFIRKFSADMGATAGTVEGTFDDWGGDVDITAPPSSQVTTMPGLG